MNEEKYIKDLVYKFGNELLKNIRNAVNFEQCLGSIIDTLETMTLQEKLSDEDVEKIWDELIKIFEEYELKHIYTIYEQVNTSTVSLVRKAKQVSKAISKRKNDLMMSRKGLKK